MTQTDVGRVNSRQEEDKSLSQFLPTKMVDSGKFYGIYTSIKDTDNIIHYHCTPGQHKIR